MNKFQYDFSCLDDGDFGKIFKCLDTRVTR